VFAVVPASAQLKQKVPLAHGWPQIDAYVMHLPAWQVTPTGLMVVLEKVLPTIERSSVRMAGSKHPHSGHELPHCVASVMAVCCAAAGTAVHCRLPQQLAVYRTATQSPSVAQDRSRA
jgi:hypothetical protein